MAEKIAVVDASSAGRRFLHRALATAGYAVTELDDGSDLVADIVLDRPDLVILSEALPEERSLRLCQELKNDSRTVGTPILYTVASDNTAARIRGLESGADDVLAMPLDLPEVMARVRSQLRLGQLTKHLVNASERLARRQRRLDRDIIAAAGIQRSLLPRTPPTLPNLRVGWRFRPCPLVGGHVFNVLRLDERRVGVFIVDVEGHGVPAAMVSVALSQALDPRSGFTKKVYVDRAGGRYELPAPSAMLAELEQLASERLGRAFSICYLVIDSEIGTLRYCNAGHTPPLLLRSDGSHARLGSGGPAIGHGGSGWRDASLSLAPGDRLFMFNAGLLRLASPAGEPWGDAALVRTLAAAGDLDPDRCCDAIVDSALLHAGIADEPPSDVVVAGLEFRPESKGDGGPDSS